MAYLKRFHNQTLTTCANAGLADRWLTPASSAPGGRPWPWMLLTSIRLAQHIFAGVLGANPHTRS